MSHHSNAHERLLEKVSGRRDERLHVRECEWMLGGGPLERNVCSQYIFTTTSEIVLSSTRK